MSRQIRTLLAAALAAAAPAVAVDGVIEISQARALAGLPGDSPGFPVTIGGGSYRLTSNLVVADEGLDAIVVQAANVTIDLNGFSIVGPTVCAGTPPGHACSPENATSAGIDAGTFPGLTVTNGTLRGMPQAGVVCGPRCHLVDVRAVINGRDGAIVGSGSVVEGSQFDQNGNWGLRAVAGSSGVEVVRSVATFNGDGGFSLDLASRVDSSVARINGGNGILATSGRIEGNIVTGNTLSGIVLNSGIAVGNVTAGNQSHGINLTGSTVGLGGNAVAEAPPTGIAGTWVELAGNLCSNAVCP